jgi:pilus assembly protein CpaB
MRPHGVFAILSVDLSMNNQRLIAALCFAFLCSGLFTWQLNRHMGHAKTATAVPVRTVVVAAKDLAAGEALTIASLSTVTLPASQPLQGLFSKPQDVVGRVLLTPLSSGEMITLHGLASVDAPAGIASTIPNGMRVISVPTTDPSGNAGLLTTGNHIDVFVSYHSDAGAAVVSSLVLQDITILGGAQKGSSGADPKPSPLDTINLLVTAEDAARLTAASALGKLTFALRNGADKSLNAGLSHVTLTAEHTVVATPVRRSSQSITAPQSKGFAVETIAGGKSSVQTFSDGGQ